MFAPMVTVTHGFLSAYGHKVINLIQQPHTVGHLFLVQAIDRIHASFFAFHILGFFFQMTENEGNTPLPVF